MKLMDAFYVPRKIKKDVFTPLWLSCEARAILFECQQRERKPLWMSCEARSDLFKCGEGPKM